MPKLLICYKWVLDEQDIKITPGSLMLDTSRAKYKISDYDRNAIEEATLLVEKHGGSADALTFGGAAVRQSLKDVLSRGPDKAYYISDAAAEKADAFVIASGLAAAIRKLGAYDLVICGEGSSDAYNQQVAPRLAVLLGVPAVTYVHKIDLDGDKFIATRKLADCTEIVRFAAPAVISVLPEINKPRVPSLKQVLGAAKKPTQELKLADIGIATEETLSKTRLVSVKGFVMNRKNVVFKGDDQAANVQQLVSSLAQEGLV